MGSRDKGMRGSAGSCLAELKRSRDGLMVHKGALELLLGVTVQTLRGGQGNQGVRKGRWIRGQRATEPREA